MAEVVADLLRDELIPEARLVVATHANSLSNCSKFLYQLPKWIATHQLWRRRATFWTE